MDSPGSRAWFVMMAFMVAVLGSSAPRTVSSQGEDRSHTFRTTPGGPSLSVRARVRTGIQPKSVNVSPDGSRVVTCNFGRPDAHSVSFFDAYTLEQVGEAAFEGNAVESVFTQDGRRLFVSNFRMHRVEVLDIASCYGASAERPCHVTPSTSIAVGHHPKFIALSPDETVLYVANYGDASVSVVDLASTTELRRRVVRTKCLPPSSPEPLPLLHARLAMVG